MPSLRSAARVASLLLALAAASVSAQTPVPPPACTGDEWRQFDFWLGDWNVYGKNGQLAGTNRITREYAGCVLHERYETPRGYAGESLNTYDAGRRVWHQTWVDNGGTLLLLEGGLRDGAMVLQGQTTDTAGKATRHRITWTPHADGSVRQHWESTDDKGAWTTAFDGRYVRK